jgi:undecaprenyl-diphosphatase
MIDILELLKSILFGLIEGITEWLPISSTGHMILVDQFIRMQQSDAFKEMFLVVIQLGAILAVVVLFWRKLNPFTVGQAAVSPAGQPEASSSNLVPPPRKGGRLQLDRAKLVLWLKIIIACIPAGIIGVKFNDEIDAIFYNYQTVSITLIVYGVLFILIERWNRQRKPQVTTLGQMPVRTALYIGLFQVLSIIPGTSRSGSTILGAMLLGTSRPVAAEFSFFLGIPLMFGASLVKLLDFGFSFTMTELFVLLTGMIVAFVSSVFAIRFLVGYVKRHDFRVFGWYRIALGILVLVLFQLI